ncbi:DUF1127 domain-containing protein [Stutzerimonas stutzeri]|uniref:DUF1127 domain-containing protein n=1 Tax=Stutzerimonas sp. S1 TaxID=3030652 RepID=UPI002224EDD1|nr:DUF1127 domain-containing protein [Stutzerimonas sp. S1]MCW3150524.1 DUF1127 domain-containing protein [Stutzerimonas sp. S1]
MDRVLPRVFVTPQSATWLPRLLHTLRLWQQRAQTRRQLAQLDARQLADAGISASERLEELEKPFWR